MTWVKLDDQFADHPKMVVAGPFAMLLHVKALCYCARYLTDGFVPAAVVNSLVYWPPGVTVDNQALAQALAQANAWELCEGGYRIHDYLEYQPSREDELQRRAARAEAGKIGGLRSAQAKRQANAQASAQAKPQANGKQNSTPSPSPSSSPTEKATDVADAEVGQLETKPELVLTPPPADTPSHKRQRKPKQQELPDPGKADLDAVRTHLFGAFAGAWSERYGGKYQRTSADPGRASDEARNALQAADDELAVRDEGSRVELACELLDHRVAGYLDLDEPFLVQNRHPLSLLGQKRHVFGLPQGWDGAAVDSGASTQALDWFDPNS